MGIYNVVCQGCQTRFQWFSGALNQLCKQCNDKLVNDSNENKSIFSKLTEQEMHDLLNPHAKDGRIIDALKKERDELKSELTQCKQALEQTNDGRPSEWAYSILRKERDELKSELESLDYSTVHTCHANCKRLECVQRREIETLNGALKSSIKSAQDNIEAVRRQRDELKAEVELLKGELESQRKHFQRLYEKSESSRLLIVECELSKLKNELESERAKSLKYCEALEKIKTYKSRSGTPSLEAHIADQAIEDMSQESQNDDTSIEHGAGRDE